MAPDCIPAHIQYIYVPVSVKLNTYDGNSHDDRIEVIENERNPIRRRFAAALAVDARPEDLAEDGDRDGQQDDGQNGPAPRNDGGVKKYTAVVYLRAVLALQTLLALQVLKKILLVLEEHNALIH